MIITKVCPKCQTEFSFEKPKTGHVRTFCSRQCANSRTRSAEVKKKIGESVRDTWNKTSAEGKKKKLEALDRARQTVINNNIARIQETPTEELGPNSRKKKVFLEQKEKCNCCGIADWNGKPLTFELEHKDGNKLNNLRNNLEVLCPNCHAQTSTWRGRNNKGPVA